MRREQGGDDLCIRCRAETDTELAQLAVELDGIDEVAAVRKRQAMAVQQLQDPPVGGLIELIVQRPHVIGRVGSQPLRSTPATALPCRPPPTTSSHSRWTDERDPVTTSR
jgi:hypothetical protein